MDHIFISLGLTNTSDDGEITAIAAARISQKGDKIAVFADNVRSSELEDYASFSVVIHNAIAELLKPEYGTSYVLVATHAETARRFLKEAWNSIDNRHTNEPFGAKRWIDILQLAWPLCYNGYIELNSFENVCQYLNVVNEDTTSAMSNCKALAESYFRLMKQYKVALGSEGTLRSVGGKAYDFFLGNFVK